MVLKMEKVDVIAECATGMEALTLCRKLKPTFLLADLRLPGLDAVSVLLRLRAEKLDIPVMIHTGCVDDRQIRAALEARPAVLVHKMDEIEDFRMGLRSAAAGRTYFSARPARVHGMRRSGSETEPLSPCEAELLKLIASGHSNKVVAALLEISEKTVKHRREELMRKLDAHEVTALVRHAVRLGLVEC